MGFGWTVAVYRSHYLTHILVLAKYVKHSGQIQPVTTHLRVNIREFILSIKQYGDHLYFSHYTHLLYKWAQWAYTAHGLK